MPDDDPTRRAGGVTLLLVSHDGATWLPTVLAALAASTVRPTAALAVDTGSRDASAALLEQAGLPVHRLPASTGWAGAVATGLQQAAATGHDTQWFWLLHDDAAPAPDALARLLERAEADPGADVLGPALREWPSLRRLLEVGVTVSGTGQRETGLEAGEYDQGQHDDVHDVLAVNTAGMLVRRSVLERLGGFDPALPVFGPDLDLGWRAATAGLRTVVVPSAVVFHAEASGRGLRRSSLVGTHPHLQRRRAGLFVVLVNSRPGALVLQVPRLVVGTVLRILGFLAVREPVRALDELVAVLAVLARPGELLAARRARRALVDDAEGVSAARARVRPLLAPPWTPYRHGLDFLTDVGTALTQQAGDVAERRREAAAGRDPSSFAARRQEALGLEGAEEDTGWVARFVTNPVAVLLALVVVLALVGARTALGSVTGGGLSPTPGSVGDWWALVVQSRHPLVQGTSVPAPAYLLPLALLGTLLGGSATAAVSVLLVACVPLALWGAWRFLRVLGRLSSLRGVPRWLILWGAATFALLPVVSGAWGDGRLGPVVAATVLPWLGHAALGFADPEADRRRRAGWRVGLLATVVVGFAPFVWLVLLVLVATVLVAGWVLARSTVRERSVWLPLVVAVLVPVVLLAPWWAWALASGAAEGLLLDAGRLPAAGLDRTGVLLGRLGGADGPLGAPVVVGLVLPVLALLALAPRRSRAGVAVCWYVAAVVALLAAALSRVDLDLAATTVGPGLAVAPLLVQGAFVVAAVLGAQAVVEAAAGRRPLQAAAALLGVVGLAVPVVGLAWWVVDPATTPDDTADDIPAYMVQSAELGPEHGILVLRGSTDEGLRYLVRRGDGVTLGEDEIIALSPEDDSFTAAVADFVARPAPEVVDTLARNGIEYVVLPGPADGEVAASLDATPGLVQAGAGDRATRAWRIDRELDDGGVAARTSVTRGVALGLQALAVLAVVVLCVPSRRRAR